MEYVEEETLARGTQSCAISWGVDRIDQVSSTLDCRYNPLSQGEGSDIYILDSGTTQMTGVVNNFYCLLNIQVSIMTTVSLDTGQAILVMTLWMPII